MTTIYYVYFTYEWVINWKLNVFPVSAPVLSVGVIQRRKFPDTHIAEMKCQQIMILHKIHMSVTVTVDTDLVLTEDHNLLSYVS